VHRARWVIAATTIAAGATLAVGVTALGGGGSKGSKSQIVIAAAASNSAQPRLVSPWVSPLSWFVTGDTSSLAAQTRYEATIVTCMASKGFVYYPLDRVFAQGPPATVSAMTSYRDTFGYGLSISPSSVTPQSPGSPVTTIGPVSAVVPGQSGGMAGQSGGMAGSALQANEAYVAGLSATRRQSYDLALSAGLMSGVSGVGGMGCEAQANVKRSAGLPITDQSVRSVYTADVTGDLSSPTLSAAQRAWNVCMKSAGWTVATPQAAKALAAAKISSALSAGPSELKAAGATQIDIARADWGCQLATTEPAIQNLEMAQVATLAQDFPQYVARAARA